MTKPPKKYTMTTAVENQPTLRQTRGGRCGGPVAHSSYTTRRDVTKPTLTACW